MCPSYSFTLLSAKQEYTENMTVVGTTTCPFINGKLPCLLKMDYKTPHYYVLYHIYNKQNKNKFLIIWMSHNSDYSSGSQTQSLGSRAMHVF